MKTLGVIVEMSFMWTAVEHKLFDFKKYKEIYAEVSKINVDNWRNSKKNWVNIFKSVQRNFFRKKCDNANLLKNVIITPRESCLFFVRIQIPGIGLAGDKNTKMVKLPEFLWCLVSRLLMLTL